MAAFEQLKEDSIDAADIADRGIVMFSYIVKVDKIIDRWNTELTSVESLTEPVAKLRKIQTITDEAGTELAGLKPPTSLVPFRLELTELLGTMTTKLGEMVAAANAKDAAKLEALSKEWETLATSVGKLSSTVGGDVADDIMPPSDQRKLNRLADKIDRF